MPIKRSDTRLSDALVAEYEAAGYWNVPTFPELVRRNAEECPERVAFVEGGTSVTWAEVWSTSTRLAGHLLAFGVERGDVVGMQLPNCLHYIYALTAINMIGAIACPHLHTLRSSELRFVLGFSEAVVTIVPHTNSRGFSYCDMLSELRPELPALRKVLVIESEGALPDGFVRMEDLLAADADVPELAAELAKRAPQRHDVNRLLFTSGSTGDPKGVLHTYATTVFSNVQVNGHLGVDEDSVLLLFIPITLNWGMFHVIQTALARCRLILFREFEIAKVLETVERERVTHLGGPPTALVGIQRDGTYRKHDLSSVVAYVTSGTSCPIELLQQCRRELGWSIVEGYGITECGWVAATRPDDRPEETVGTVGRPFPGLELHLEDVAADADGAELTAQQVTLRGPTICLGYYKNPERNAASWSEDGYFRTGDLGAFDESGRLRIVGRAKDLIIHGGANIIPRELEELLFTHPKVSDVAVIGVPDSYFGEAACACIVPRAGETTELAEVIAFLTDRIAKYKLPQHVELFDTLPYTSTGKIQKFLLKEEVAKRAEARSSDAERKTG